MARFFTPLANGSYAEASVFNAPLNNIDANLGYIVDNILTRPQFRLSFQNNNPYVYGDIGNQTTLYLNPLDSKGVYMLYQSTIGDYILLQLGSTPLSLSLASIIGGTLYDVFLALVGGTPTLLLEAWTNLTTRANNLQIFNGVLTSGLTFDRLYLGTMYATGNGGTIFSNGFRTLWNQYNRIPIPFRVVEATGHAYNGALREWNGGFAARVYFVTGSISSRQVEPVYVNMMASITFGATPGTALCSVGLNTIAAAIDGDGILFASGSVAQNISKGNILPSPGLNSLIGLEQGGVNNTFNVIRINGQMWA